MSILPLNAPKIHFSCSSTVNRAAKITTVNNYFDVICANNNVQPSEFTIFYVGKILPTFSRTTSAITKKCRQKFCHRFLVQRRQLLIKFSLPIFKSSVIALFMLLYLTNKEAIYYHLIVDFCCYNFCFLN